MHDVIRAVVRGSGLETELGTVQIETLRNELDENIAAFETAISEASAVGSTTTIGALLAETAPLVTAYGGASIALFGKLGDITSTDAGHRRRSSRARRGVDTLVRRAQGEHGVADRDHR